MSRRLLVAGVSGLLGLALTGCGAGQTAATAADAPSAPGVDVTLDGIAVRNATVEYSVEGYPAGADVPVRLTVLNQTTEPVRLAELASPVAASVTIAEAVRVAEQAVDPQQPPDGAGAPDPAGFELAPGALYTVSLQASGVREPVPSTGALPLRLSFEPGTVVELTVPVAPPLEPLPRGEPIDVGHH